MLTGARITALASFRLVHVDLTSGYIEQDARSVRTKFSKTFRTYFMPVDAKAREIVSDWIAELTRDYRWVPGRPAIPRTEMGLDCDGGFVAVGLARRSWATSAPVREIFRRAFAGAGLTLLQSAFISRHAGAPRHDP